MDTGHRKVFQLRTMWFCAGVLIGSGMGGLTIFQDGVKNLVEKGYKKITPFFIPYAITNMCTPGAHVTVVLYLVEEHNMWAY